MLYHTLGQYTTYLQARKLGVLSFEISSETFQLVSEKHITRSIMSNSIPSQELVKKEHCLIKFFKLK